MIVAQPFDPSPASARPSASAYVVIDGQTLPVAVQDLGATATATATATGRGSTSQAALSISFTLSLEPDRF